MPNLKVFGQKLKRRCEDLQGRAEFYTEMRIELGKNDKKNFMTFKVCETSQTRFVLGDKLVNLRSGSIFVSL